MIRTVTAGLLALVVMACGSPEPAPELPPTPTPTQASTPEPTPELPTLGSASEARPLGPGTYRYRGRYVTIPDGFVLVDISEYREEECWQPACREGQDCSERCEITKEGLFLNFESGCSIDLHLWYGTFRLNDQDGLCSVVLLEEILVQAARAHGFNPGQLTHASDRTYVRRPLTAEEILPMAPESCPDYNRYVLGEYPDMREGTSFYLGMEVERTEEFHTHHVVSLKEACESGLPRYQWHAFATFRPNLVPAYGPLDQSKGDSDPSEWSAPHEYGEIPEERWCAYLKLHVEVKRTWRLTADEEELTFLAESGCFWR